MKELNPGSLTQGGPRQLRERTRIIVTQSTSQKQKHKAWFFKARFKARMERGIIEC